MKGSKSGMSADEVYVTKWKFYNALLFLSDHVNTLRKTATNLNVSVSIYYNTTTTYLL